MRASRPAVIGRVQDGAFLLDVRTLFDHDLEAVTRAVYNVREG
jgi:hypothetical protein